MIQRFLGLAVLACGCLVASRAAKAEAWPSLDDLASDRFLLIVHCRAEQVDARVLYKVLDVWKGEYSPMAFAKQPPTNYINTPGPEGVAGGRTPGSEAILVYTRHNQSKEGISRHDMTIPVRDRKLTYPPGNVELFSGQREYTVAEFKREITSRIEKRAPGSTVKVDYERGFRTACEPRFLRPYWDSVQDRHKMQGKVSDHLTKEQIDSIIVIELNIAITDDPRYANFEPELLGFMAPGNRFQTGPLPEGFEKESAPKYLVALVRTKAGDYGLITRYASFTVLEMKGLFGVVPIPGQR